MTKKYIKSGLSNTRFYNVYCGMKSRCNNKNHHRYKYYGERGIKLKWINFLYFKNDMYNSYLEHCNNFGEKNTTIDRIDNNGNYCKENCRWATKKEQLNNYRRNHLIKYNGKIQNMKQWSEELNFSYRKIADRINRLKWPIKKAFK